MAHLVVFTTFDGVAPSDPPGQVVVNTFIRVVLDSGPVTDGRPTEFPCSVTLAFGSTPNQISSATRAEVIAECGRQGYTGVVANDIITVSAFTRG